MDFLDFDRNPEFVAAFRFTVWALFLGLAAVAWKYFTRLRAEVRAKTINAQFMPEIPFGALLAYPAFGLHQFYYWLRWRAEAHEDAALLSALNDIRHVTSLLLVVMAVGGLFYMSSFMNDLFGRRWLSAGIAVLVILWTIGYVDARWA